MAINETIEKVKHRITVLCSVIYILLLSFYGRETVDVPEERQGNLSETDTSSKGDRRTPR